MADQPSLRSLSCPNCGAPIHFPEDDNSVRCAFCGSVIERSGDAPTPDDEGRALKINLVDGRVTVERPLGDSSTARRFTIKMQGGQPVIIEAGGQPDPALGAIAKMVQASRQSVTYENLPRPRSARAANLGGCAGGIVVLIIVLAVGLPLGVVLFTIPQVSAVLRAVARGDFGSAGSALSTIGTRIYVNDSAALVPSTSDAPPDILTLTTIYPNDNSDGEKRLAALSSAAPKMLWRSEPLDKDTYYFPLLADRERVYTVSGTRLLALSRTDGTLAWEAALADRVSLNTCLGCVLLLNDHVAALSDDGTLQVFDAATGQPAWSLRANQDSPRGLYALGGQLAFADQDEENDGILRVFDPGSGEAKTLKPECRYNESSASNISWYTPLYSSAPGTEFYLAYGSPDLCLQRWDAKTLTMTWEAKITGESSEPDVPPLVTNDDVFLTFGTKVVAADAATGEVRTLADSADDELVPVAVQDNLLIVRARRTRGSTRYSLWALDKTTGERKWEFDMGTDLPLDPPGGNTGIIDDETSVWTLHPMPDGLMVLRFRRAADDVSHAIFVETLDWQTGASGGQRRIPLGVQTIILSAPAIVGWTNDTLWFSIEQVMMGLDTTSGQINYRWP